MRVDRLLVLLPVLSLITSAAYGGEIHGAARDGDMARLVTLIAADSTLVNTAGDGGGTPLQAAAFGGHLEAVNLLIDAGADIEAADGRGMTALLWAAYGRHADVAGRLLDRGADLSASAPGFGSVVDVAFHRECQSGYTGITAFLVDRGAEFDASRMTPFGMSRLHLACVFGSIDMMEFLLARGADVNTKAARNGKTPLVDAASRGLPEVAMLLIDHGADVTIADDDGIPAIWYAVKKGLEKVVTALIEHGSATDYVDPRYGHTLLHLAAIKGYRGIVDALLAAGMAVDAADGEGRSPLYYAARYGHRAVADLLVGHDAAENQGLAENYGGSIYMAQPPASGGAVAWYLNNRGWAVKTHDHMCIIDYEQFREVLPTEPSLANGFITPAEIGNQDVYVLYTCYHGDQGELSYMHQLRDSLRWVTYIHGSEDRWRADIDVTFMNPGETRIFDGVRVHAIKPTSDEYMPTMGYLVLVDDLTIFYAGFATDSLEAYRRALEEMAQHVDMVDIAFLPIPEPGAEATSDFKMFLDRFHPRAVCLLDPNRREYLFPALADSVAAWNIETEVFGAENPGDRFVFRRQK